VFWICRLRGVEVVVIEADAKANFEVDLAKDVLEVITGVLITALWRSGTSEQNGYKFRLIPF
jgi:predicted site-specific integrase-resolvase